MTEEQIAMLKEELTKKIRIQTTIKTLQNENARLRQALAKKTWPPN